MKQNAVEPQAQFLRLPQLRQRFSVASSSIWYWVKKGDFPKPIKLGANTTAWLASDVEAWAKDRIAKSQCNAKGGHHA